MLAFMSSTPPLPVHTPTTSSTMSLAILPAAPMAYSQSSGPTLLASPSPAKRPKLSLNTHSVPATVFGKGSTSLRLDTLSATSPTTRNTFRNAYSQSQLQSQETTTFRTSKPILAPLSTNVSNLDERPAHIEREESFDSAASSASTSSTASSINFSTAEVPYRVSYNLKSALVNSPIPRASTRITSFAQSKPMFPASKKVTFKSPLTEDIHTTEYTMKHSDILASSTSTISTLELSPPDKTLQGEDEKPETIVRVETKEPSSPQTGDKRESSDEEDSDTCPVTPIAGRKKRHRDWRWTLGTVNSTSDQQEQEPEPTGDSEEQSNNV